MVFNEKKNEKCYLCNCKFTILYYFTKRRRTSFALGCSHSTTDSHHSSGHASMFQREGGGDGWPFSSNRRQIGILFSFSQDVTSISLRELQISFALQMLFSSGKQTNSRVINFGRMTSVMELEVLLSSSVVPIISSIFSQLKTAILSRFTRFGSNTSGNSFFILLQS